MKKRYAFTLLLFAFILLLGACTKKSDDKDKADPLISSKQEMEGASMEAGDGYGFDTFDLSIEIDGEEVVHTDYDVRRKAEATYVDKTKRIDVEGKEAMDELFYLFNHMRLAKDKSNDEIIQKVMEHYELDDYSSFILNAEFDEGTTLHISEGR